MYIKEIKKRNKPYDKEFISHRLIEAYRTEKGPRHRTILNLGKLDIPKAQWKTLADAIEAKISGQKSLFQAEKEIDDLANAFAEQIVKKHLLQKPSAAEVERPAAEYHKVDIHSLQSSQCRTIGAEHVGLHAFNRLGLESFLAETGFSPRQINLAKLSIIGRLVHPGSELQTADWARHLSGLDELIDTDFKHLSHNALYRISDSLYENKEAIETYLARTEKDLFSLPEKIVLYDLTNTYFEGNANSNVKARRGRSKEKRRDCPLLTLALVIDEQGFVKNSRVLPGNVSEPGTLEEMLKTLQTLRPGEPSKAAKPGAGITVLMDAGIATKDNLKLLQGQGYDYIVVSRQKALLAKLKNLTPLVTVNESKGNLVQASLTIQDDEAILICKSKLKAVKENSMRTLFEKRFEEDLQSIANALAIKGGVKTYAKVRQRIDRLIEKHKRISRYYKIDVLQQGRLATEIKWQKINQQRAEERFSGVYYLRTSRIDLNEKEIWSLYTMLTNLEDAFRSLKSELNLRPVFHRKEARADAHIFIAVLAYHLLNTIQTGLRSNGIHMRWQRIRELLSSHVRITTWFNEADKGRLYIRKTAHPEAFHKTIYNALGLSHLPGNTKQYTS
jgi:transposase